MPLAAADLTSIASLTGRELASRLARIARPHLPGLQMTRCTGLGLTLASLVSADASRAPELYRGCFELGGCRVVLRGGSIFSLQDARPAAFDSALNSFAFLHDLEAARGQLYRVYARGLIAEWIEERAWRQPAARQMSTLSWRVINWVQCAPYLLSGASRSFELSFFNSLTAQIRLIMRKGPDASLPDERLLAAIALAYGVFGTAGLEALHKTALYRLSNELDSQILADGGHVSRNGEVLCMLLSLLLPLREAMQCAYVEVPGPINAALERMLPMLRFLRHSDGKLAVFQGVSRTHAGRIKAILDHDKVGGRPLSHAQLSGFARLAHGHASVIMDAGQPAMPGDSASAAASPLALEFCDGAHRIVVNCGNRPVKDDEWRRAARLTSAHSTICLGETDTSAILGGRLFSRLFGNAPLLRRGEVEAEVNTDERGSVVTARHTCYARPYGLACQRRIFLSADGHDLRGEDQFIAAAPEEADTLDPAFQIRFHLHPSVKATLSRDGSSIMLVLPSKTGWKFTARGGRMSLEPSIYMPDVRNPRPSEQIVISGIAGRPQRVQWAFKRINKAAGRAGSGTAEAAPELPLTAG
jgi:uncharacterized heparinase superfamily protein